MAIVTQELMTVEEYALLPDMGSPTELVQGKVIALNQPTPGHGRVCAKFVRYIGNYVDEHHLGNVVSNDSAIITKRGPDSVRGADVAYYSHARASEEQFKKKGYFPVVPELVVEVRSESDRWQVLLGKAAEYLEAGVTLVCVADPEPRTIHVYRADQPVQVLTPDQDFTLPELFPDFRVSVRKFFE